MELLTFLMFYKNYSLTDWILLDIFLLFAIIPLVDDLVKNRSWTKYFKFNKTVKSLVFNGFKSRTNDWCPRMPIQISAVSYHIAKNRLGKAYQFCNNNVIEVFEDSKILSVIVLDKCIKVNDYITVRFSSQEKKTDKETQETIEMIIETIREVNDIEGWLEGVIKDYINYTFSNRIYMQTLLDSGFGRSDPESRMITEYIASYDNTGKIIDNWQTFDHLFLEHKEQFLRDVEQLKDIDFYRRTGQRRKKGYLLYGEPGCGKTATILAMALHDKRQIINVPLDRINSARDIDMLFSTLNFKHRLIIVFDEIDKVDFDSLEYEFNEDDEEGKGNKIKKSKNKRQTNILGTLLGKLDGMGNYDDVIYVATANDIKNLPECLYRHGRLDPYYFGYMSSEKIQKMITHFYDVDISGDKKLVDAVELLDNKKAPSTLSYYMNKLTLEQLLDTENSPLFEE